MTGPRYRSPISSALLRLRRPRPRKPNAIIAQVDKRPGSSAAEAELESSNGNRQN